MEVLRQIPDSYGVPPKVARLADEAAEKMDRFPVADFADTVTESSPSPSSSSSDEEGIDLEGNEGEGGVEADALVDEGEDGEELLRLLESGDEGDLDLIGAEAGEERFLDGDDDLSDFLKEMDDLSPDGEGVEEPKNELDYILEEAIGAQSFERNGLLRDGSGKDPMRRT